MKLLNFYFKLQKYVVNEEEDWEDWEDLPEGIYTLLIEPTWYKDANKGLAVYLDEGEDLEKYVKYIHYKCNKYGYLKFEVQLLEEEDFKIKYGDKEMTLKDAVAFYIQGQVSDGWGESGVYVIDGGFIGDPVLFCKIDWDIYEEDTKTWMKNKLENNDYSLLDDCNLFKKLEIKYG